MDLMRIYDKNSDSIGLTKIIGECNRWKSEISSLYEDKDEIRPLSITLSSDEMQECSEDKKMKRKIVEEKRFHDTTRNSENFLTTCLTTVGAGAIRLVASASVRSAQKTKFKRFPELFPPRTFFFVYCVSVFGLFSSILFSMIF